MINAHRDGFFTVTEAVADDETPSGTSDYGMHADDGPERVSFDLCGRVRRVAV